MQRTLITLAIAASLAACSTTKLDDKTNAGAGTDAQSTVAPVGTESGLAGSGGPQDVAKVVYFDFDQYTVRADARPVVDGNARWLSANKGAKVVLEGHTDAVGGREYNLALGQKRAEAVRKALAVSGVADSQMEAVSFGKERPAVADDGQNEKNRRVEFKYR